MTVEQAEENSEFEWTPYFEVHLIHSMGGLKLLGVNQHFFTAIVLERFYSAVGMEVPVKVVLQKINSYYDIEEGNKMQRELPFPNDPCEFSLPPDEFPNLGSKQETDDRFLTDDNSLGSKSETSSNTSSDNSLKKEIRVLTPKLGKKDIKKLNISAERKSSLVEKKKHASYDTPGRPKDEVKKVAAGKKRPGGERKSDPPMKRSRH